MIPSRRSCRARLVALLAEGVDRNRLVMMTVPLVKLSPSSRRAWIEILSMTADGRALGVALLAEGVDRNQSGAYCSDYRPRVALLAEGVDRNKKSRGALTRPLSRPPRGGRG